MKVKRYVGETAQEALQKVKTDLGRDAIILNTRKIRKKGLMGFFTKPLVEVVATIDGDIPPNKLPRPQEARPVQASKAGEYIADQAPVFKSELDATILNRNAGERPRVVYSNPSFQSSVPQNGPAGNPQGVSGRNIAQEQKNGDKDKLQQDFNELKSMLNKVYDAVKVDYENNKLSDTVKKYLQQLEEYEVDKAIINDIKEKLVEQLDEEKQLDDKAVKSTLAGILKNYMKDPQPFSFEDGKKVIIFIGPTGVGKTTTLAKLAANMVLTEKKKVGLITSDTYRIAAVEQLKTYSEIIGVPLSIIYTPNEILNAINSYDEKNIVLVDTAGRSHKDKYQLVELKSLIKSSVDYEVYLVISATTKFSDCIEIIKNYSFLEDYKLLFTKLDETDSLGVVLNVAYLTQKPIAYITTGQSVPDDIEIADNNKIINCLLGDKLYERSS